MLRSIIKYGGLALIIVGIVIVTKNLFTSDTEWENSKKNNKNKDSYYSVKVSLLDKESNSFISGANLTVKDESGTVISGWTTDDSAHLITNLKQGSYTLVQETAKEGYHLNSDVIKFKIKDKDETVVMYNIKMTEAELKNQGNTTNNQVSNNTSNEVGVENTSSTKSIYSYIISLIFIALGTKLIFIKKEVN